MQSAITERKLTPAMAALVTRNGRRFSLLMYIAAGLWAAFWLGLGLWATITKDDTTTLLFTILGGAFGATICIYLGRNFWAKAARDAASGRYLYYAGPVDIKVTTQTDSDGTLRYYQLAFEGRLVSVDETTARRVKNSGGWVGVAFTPSGDFVFEVVDRQGQPLHRAAGYGPAPPTKLSRATLGPVP